MGQSADDRAQTVRRCAMAHPPVAIRPPSPPARGASDPAGCSGPPQEEQPDLLVDPITAPEARLDKTDIDVPRDAVGASPKPATNLLPTNLPSVPHVVLCA